ncbi:2,3-diketo-5-methylthio-1-phosphopentane phosphatase, partial [Pseudomonas sp. KHB2.9]
LVIGDGKSDMCVASTADFVFAKGSLARYCEANNIPHARFDTFAEVSALLAKLPQGIAANATTFAPTDLSIENQELFHHV